MRHGEDKCETSNSDLILIMIKEKSKLWQQASGLIGQIFSKLPFTPDTYSWSTIPAAIIAFIFVCYGYFLWGGVFFLISGLLDIIDGGCARSRGHTSARGAFLDGSLDRVVDFIFMGSFFWLPLKMPIGSIGAWVYITGFVVIMPTFIVAYANHRQAVIDPDEKIIWRILNRGEIYILMLAIVITAHWSAVLASYLLIFLVVLGAITIVQSFCLAMHHARMQSSS